MENWGYDCNTMTSQSIVLSSQFTVVEVSMGSCNGLGTSPARKEGVTIKLFFVIATESVPSLVT
jgi:hypothetical protein